MKRNAIKLLISIVIALSAIMVIEKTIMPAGLQKSYLLYIDYIVFNYLPLMFFTLVVFLITNKLIASTIISSAFIVALEQISNIKYKALECPLIAYDFQLIKQIFEDINLYIKYLPGYSFIILMVFIVAIIIMMRESRFLNTSMKSTFARLIILLLITVVIVSGYWKTITMKIYKMSSLEYVVFNPEASVKSAGLFFTLVRTCMEQDFELPSDYGKREIFDNLVEPEVKSRKLHPLPKVLPDIVVVQSEAFYDLRRLNLNIEPQIYQNFDDVTVEANWKGQITVPVFGGYTLIPEFSFLTGIPTSILPPECKFPYRSLVNHQMWSIASYLKTIGYKTIVVHPFSRSFWNRNFAMPLLGFDRFIDIREFSDKDKEGFYVSDRALMNKLITVLNNTESPVFVFAITVENHGPWDIKRVDKEFETKINALVSDKENKELKRYAHHLINANKMIKELKTELTKRDRPAVLTFYGDHAPAFYELFKTTNNADLERYKYQAPYFIWKNYDKKKNQTADVDVSFLASMVLTEAGLNNDEYFIKNSIYNKLANGDFKKNNISSEINRSYVQMLYETIREGKHVAH